MLLLVFSTWQWLAKGRNQEHLGRTTFFSIPSQTILYHLWVTKNSTFFTDCRLYITSAFFQIRTSRMPGWGSFFRLLCKHTGSQDSLNYRTHTNLTSLWLSKTLDSTTNLPSKEKREYECSAPLSNVTIPLLYSFHLPTEGEPDYTQV